MNNLKRVSLIALWFWDDSPGFIIKKTWFSVGLWGYFIMHHHAPLKRWFILDATPYVDALLILLYLHNVSTFLGTSSTYKQVLIDPLFLATENCRHLCSLKVPGCDVSSIGGSRIGCHHLPSFFGPFVFYVTVELCRHVVCYIYNVMLFTNILYIIYICI